MAHVSFLFPELSLTGYDRHLTSADAITATDPRLQQLQKLADGRHLLVIAGAPVVSVRGLDIGALCFLPGLGLVTYLKRYLHEGEEVAFVEAMRCASAVRLYASRSARTSHTRSTHARRQLVGPTFMRRAALLRRMDMGPTRSCWQVMRASIE